jgi:hypothetical protein
MKIKSLIISIMFLSFTNYSYAFGKVLKKIGDNSGHLYFFPSDSNQEIRLDILKGKIIKKQTIISDNHIYLVTETGEQYNIIKNGIDLFVY